MTTSNPLVHAGDPTTSYDAAVQLDADGRLNLKEALISLLDEKPRTGDELTSAYAHQAEFKRWPILADFHNVKRRLSELHTRHHVIRESGETRVSRMGRRAVVWELAVPADEARMIVRMKAAA